ncbi:hypothetical protein K2X05_07230 [bacterium]|nr:hypothetical protein [bacterium]
MKTFNLANIYELRGKYERTSATDLVPVPEYPPRPKTDHHVQELQKIISESNPDIAVLTEVESLEALQRFSRQFPIPYKSYLVSGNDARNIEIGLIVKSDLPIDVEVHSHKDYVWQDPVTRRRSPLFTRDLPAYILRKSKETAPFMIIFGMHAISRRVRPGSPPGDPHSDTLRAAQFEKTVEIVKEYQKKYGADVPMMIAGDFNTDVQFAKEMEVLKRFSVSAFDVAQSTIPKAARVTHTFHETLKRRNPDTGEKEEYELNHMVQLDDIRLIGFPEEAVLSASVHRYTDEHGRVLPFAMSYLERLTQTSDHLPVVVELLTEALPK